MNTNKRKEIREMIKLVKSELVESFGKTRKEAKKQIKMYNLRKALKDDEMAFHESLYDWALIILTHHEDFEAIEKSLYKYKNK